MAQAVMTTAILARRAMERLAALPQAPPMKAAILILPIVEPEKQIMNGMTRQNGKMTMKSKLSRWIPAVLLALTTLYPGMAMSQICPAPVDFLDWINKDETGAGDSADGGEVQECAANLGGNASGGTGGMMRASVQSLLASLALSDRPLAYRPGKGPAVPLSFYYSQREANQPTVFHYANLGPKWTYSGLSYIIDDPERPGENVQRYKAGGGTRRFRREDFDAASGRFAPDGRDGSVLVRLSDPVRYERRLPNGGLETYAHSDGRSAWPRRFFLTGRQDPAGNALKFHYDTQNRLIAVTDAAGGKTVLEYRHGDPLKITGIVDPAGRRAQIEYDARGRLISITDALGLVSKVSYSGRGTFIERLETPYGVTRFASGSGADRWVEITDPLGRTERIEARESVAGIADAEALAPQIPGIDNRELSMRNTFYWDAVTHTRHKGDYTKAKILHWRQEDGLAIGILSSVKEPLESRKWYVYDSQRQTSVGSRAQPISLARTLPGGQTQWIRQAWNNQGNRLMSIDPLGRETRYDYAENGTDVTRMSQKSANGVDTLIEMNWNAQHRPVTIKSAAGQVTKLGWNESGQLKGIDNESGKKAYRYDQQGRLAQIIDQQGKVQAQYAWDETGNLSSEMDSEGHTLKHAYDALNRRTKTMHPDGTMTEYTWDKLDLVQIRDRSGKQTRYGYDAARQLTSVKDTLRTIKFDYDAAGRPTSLTDGRGKVTRWQRDIQGRVIGKYTADGMKTFYEYDSAGREIKRTDALGQTRIITYGKDNQITHIAYAGGSTSTAGVSFTWDAHHPRIVSMKDSTGTTHYHYAPVGRPGALRLASVESPSGGYKLKRDGLGRLESWRISAAGEEYAFDALGRIVADRNSALGEFQYDYLGQTDQITEAKLVGMSIKRHYAYEPNTGDRRLKSIGNPQAARSYAYTSIPGSHITRVIETAESQNRIWDYQYDEIGRLQAARRSDGQSYTYVLDAADNLNYIAAPEGIRTYYHGTGNKIEQTLYQYDYNGNRTADAKHTYKWDAENRLIEIGYRNKPQRKTEFKYDGSSNRIAIIETDENKRTETRYTWCGNKICATKDEKDQLIAYYFGEGAYRPAEKKKEYYAKDHLGSIRDVLDEKGRTLVRCDYDPYGNLTNKPAAIPEFGYAGMQYHAPSGLYLTKYRAYDPKDGRWLSRDPIEEAGGINLYSYVGGNPMMYVDPLGLAPGDAPAGVYECKRPVNGKPGDKIGLLDLEHRYLCAVARDGDEGFKCYGLTHADPNDNPILGLWYEGKIAGADRGDYYYGEACTLLGEVDDQCGPELLDEIAKRPPPTFGIAPFLTDCQEWESATSEELHRKCPASGYGFKSPCVRYPGNPGC
jgi:RHS repeat-associated protein